MPNEILVSVCQIMHADNKFYIDLDYQNNNPTRSYLRSDGTIGAWRDDNDVCKSYDICMDLINKKFIIIGEGTPREQLSSYIAVKNTN